MTTLNISQPAIITVTITDEDGAPADPASISFTVAKRYSADAAVVYTQASPEVTSDVVGTWVLVGPTDESATYKVRMVSVDPDSAAQGEYAVRPSNV